jgi:hypothetical protein
LRQKAAVGATGRMPQERLFPNRPYMEHVALAQFYPRMTFHVGPVPRSLADVQPLAIAPKRIVGIWAIATRKLGVPRPGPRPSRPVRCLCERISHRPGPTGTTSELKRQGCISGRPYCRA